MFYSGHCERSTSRYFDGIFAAGRTDDGNPQRIVGFESVYDAKEQLLDSLDRCVGSRADYELRALLSVVEGDIRELEEGGEEG